MTIQEKFNNIKGNEIIKEILNKILDSKNASLLISQTDYLCDQLQALQVEEDVADFEETTD